MLKKIFIVLVILGIGTWGFVTFIKPQNVSWHKVAPGIAWKKMQIKDAGFLKSDVQVTVLRLDVSHLHVVDGKSKTAEEWRQSTKSIAAVNGGFFDSNNHSLGLRQSDGKELSALRHANWGVFFVRNGKAHILHTRDFQKADKKSITEAIQCGPRLVVNGHPTDLKEQWARRTGIGITANGKVLIAVCNSELSLPQWATFWAAKDGLHCQQALNLDGGGSSQLSVKTNKTDVEITGIWPVPDALVIR